MKLNKFLNYQNIVIIASILPIVIFGFVTYQNAKEAKLESVSEFISNMNTEKKNRALEYFEKVKFDTKNLAQTIKFFQKKSSKYISNIQSTQKKEILEFYEHNDEDILTLATKDIFQYVFKFKDMQRLVRPEYIQALHTYEKNLDVKNVLMINKNGKIVYASKQFELVNKNVTQITKPFKKMWHRVKRLKYHGKNSIRYVQLGYNKFSNSYKQYAISPFKDVDGFIAIEIDNNKLGEYLKSSHSIGKTAESYLIYKDGHDTFLATNREVKKGKIGDKKSSKYIDLAFKAEDSIATKVGSTGNIEIDKYTPIKIKNIRYTLQTTVSLMEAISPSMKDSNIFESFLKDNGYNNLILVYKNGDVFYSYKKEDIYKTNILNGKYSNIALAKSIKKVFKTKKFLLTDICSYPISPEKIAQFAIMPILDKESNIEMLVVLQLPLYALSNKLSSSNALNNIYETEETYLVGKDYKLRSYIESQSSKYNILNSYLKGILVDTEPVKSALAGNKRTIMSKDYQNRSVLSSFEKIKYSDVDWAVVSEIDELEISNSLKELKSNIYLFVFVSSFIVFFVMLLIIREKNKNDRKLNHAAKHDSLTALPNRKYILEYLEYILKYNKRDKHKGAVLFLDLDKFKLINDTYGHKAGDFVLIEVTKLLKSVLRDEDILARLGGDEFLIIMNDFKNPNDIDNLCKRILKNFKNPIKDKDRAYEVGISIGISTFPYDSNNATELLMFADTAMYATKDNGRNGYTFYNLKMTQRALQMAKIEKELRDAIKNDELTLYYQPQVNLQTQKVDGVEALVRWNHPSDGFVMPNDFIPVAEASNLIIDLGYWVLEQACKDFILWRESSCELGYIAVNMSSKQIQSADCVQSVINILGKYSVNPRRIELEITETTLISNFESTIDNINALKKLGINFSIDDFGTGYSSLSYLKALDVSTLKIDREFVKDIIEDRDDRAIVVAIIAMGHALNYNIVAEGAETKAEVELLKYLACDMVQGYYYSKPITSNKLIDFVRNSNAN